jgi:hypothetical protein
MMAAGGSRQDGGGPPRDPDRGSAARRVGAGEQGRVPIAGGPERDDPIADVEAMGGAFDRILDRMSKAHADTWVPDHLARWRSWELFADHHGLDIFGHRLGNPVTERLLRAVRRAGEQGLSGRGAYEALDGNVNKESLDSAVALLERLGLVQRRIIPAGRRGGRPGTLSCLHRRRRPRPLTRSRR